MERFLSDYENNQQRQCYVPAELPCLPFQDNEFDLALVSNLLFLYDSILDLDFHIQSILELCRVANEVRIFPLTSTLAYRSIHLDNVIKALTFKGFDISFIKPNYTFIKIAKDTLVIRK